MTIPLGVLLATLLWFLLGVAGCWCVLAVTRRTRAVRHRNAQAAADLVRPLVGRYVAGEDAPTTVVEGRSKAELRAIRKVAVHMLPRVRGVDAERLVELMDACAAPAGRFGSRGRHDHSDAAVLAGGGASAARLMDLLVEADRDWRMLAGYGLAAGGHTSAATAIIDAMEGDRAIPAAVAADILWRMGPEALPAVREALTTGSVRQRLVAVMVVGQERDMAAETALAALAEDVRQPTELRLRSAYALGRIGGLQGLGAIRSCLVGPPELVAVAARARADIGGATAAEDLAPLLRSTDHAVVHAAAVGLARLGGSGTAVLETFHGEGEAAAHIAWGRWEASRPPMPQTSVLPLPGFTAMAGLSAFVGRPSEDTATPSAGSSAGVDP